MLHLLQVGLNKFEDLSGGQRLFELVKHESPQVNETLSVLLWGRMASCWPAVNRPFLASQPECGTPARSWLWFQALAAQPKPREPPQSLLPSGPQRQVHSAAHGGELAPDTGNRFRARAGQPAQRAPLRALLWISGRL